MSLEDVPLALIEEVRDAELMPERIELLLNGYSTFEDVLRSRADPITLDRPGPPYRIIDGRHRIYLARQRGYMSVPANCLWVKARLVGQHEARLASQATTVPVDEDVTREVKHVFRTVFLVVIGIMIITLACGFTVSLGLMGLLS